MYVFPWKFWWNFLCSFETGSCCRHCSDVIPQICPNCCVLLLILIFVWRYFYVSYCIVSYHLHIMLLACNSYLFETQVNKFLSWWRHQIFSTLLALCAENSPVSLICAWTNAWVNNCEAGDLRRHCAHYDVIVMISVRITNIPPRDSWYFCPYLSGSFTGTGSIALLSQCQWNMWKSSQVMSKYFYSTSTHSYQAHWKHWSPVGLFVPSFLKLNMIYNNLFVDQQTEHNNRGVSIGCISTMCTIFRFTRLFCVPKIKTVEMGQWHWHNMRNPTVQSHYKSV